MKKKGFTLIELLAVTIVIAVIFLITMPIMLGVVERSRKAAFRDSVYGLIETADLYIASNLGVSDIEYVCDGTTCSSENQKLKFKGEVPISGSIFIENNEVRASFISNGKYCANGTRENLEIVNDCVSLDESGAEIDESLLSYTSTTNSVTIMIPVGFAIDKESGIKEYQVTLNGETKIIEYTDKDEKVTFNNLKPNKEYKAIIKVINKNNIEKGINLITKTLAFTNPSIALTNTPTTAQNGYLKSQVAKVTYNNSNITSPTYYVKTTREGTSSLAVTQSCGNGTTPSTCTNITSTTNLATNTWYKVSGNVNVTYNQASDTTGTIYAITYDGTNYSGAVTGTISKIDATSPTVALGSVTKSTNSITIPITMSDSESGLGTPTCKYSTTSGSYTTNASSVSTTNCTITGLTKETTYYYQVCVADKVGNNATCKTGNTATATMTNPSVTLINTPTTAANGYLKSQVAKVTFSNSNITSPSYYIKTTRVGTSSVGVTKSCGTETTPGTCSNITSTTNLEVNTWYQVSGNVNVTYNATATSTGTIYAITYDGTNYSGATTGTISKIDATSPTVGTISFTDIDCHSFTANLTVKDINSGLSKIVWYYKLSTDSDYSSVTDTYTTYNGSSAGTTSEVTKTKVISVNNYSKTYHVKARVYDVVGNYKDTSVANVTTLSPIATIGSTGYSSLAKAIAGAGSSTSTITMQKDTKENVTFTQGTITLALNNKTITGQLTITGGKLTINGSGNLNNTEGVLNGVGIMAKGGTLVINNGTWKSKGDVIYTDGANVTVTGGTFTSTHYAGAVTNAGTANLNGGIFTGGLLSNTTGDGFVSFGGTTNISGAQISSTYLSGIVTHGGRVIVNSGTFSGHAQGIAIFNGTVDFKGGTSTGHGSDGIAIDKGTLNVSGGKLTGTNYGISIITNSTANVTVTGGTIQGINLDGIGYFGTGILSIGNSSGSCPDLVKGANYGINIAGGSNFIINSVCRGKLSGGIAAMN